MSSAREQGIKRGLSPPRAPAPKHCKPPIVDGAPHVVAQREQGSISMCWYRIHCVEQSEAVGSCSSRDNRTSFRLCPTFKDPTTVEALRKAQTRHQALYRELVRPTRKSTSSEMAINSATPNGRAFTTTPLVSKSYVDFIQICQMSVPMFWMAQCIAAHTQRSCPKWLEEAKLL